MFDINTKDLQTCGPSYKDSGMNTIHPMQTLKF